MQVGKGGVRLSLMEPWRWPEFERSASLGGDGLFNPVFSISLPPCLLCLRVLRVCVCAFARQARFTGTTFKGWSAMAVTRLFSFFVGFFVVFISDQGFSVSLSALV